MSEPNEPITPVVRPLSAETKILREAFYAHKVKQADLMDDLAKELIKLEIAIPGIYATILKFIDGPAAEAPDTWWLAAVFILWGAALLVTLFSLIPIDWQVNTSVIKGTLTEKETLSLEGFFIETARYKRLLIIISIILFFLGLIAAATLTVIA